MSHFRFLTFIYFAKVVQLFKEVIQVTHGEEKFQWGELWDNNSDNNFIWQRNKMHTICTVDSNNKDNAKMQSECIYIKWFYFRRLKLLYRHYLNTTVN